jgi:hypothetical protein
VVCRVAAEFAWRHLVNTAKRIFYCYYLRSFNIASIEVVVGLLAIAGGVSYGASRWIHGALTNTPATSGMVMIAALPVIVGVQLVLAFLSYDLQNVPHEVLHRRLA